MPETGGPRVVILGAGRSPSGNLPSAMVSVDANHQLMDWLLTAFSVSWSMLVLSLCRTSKARARTGPEAGIRPDTIRRGR